MVEENTETEPSSLELRIYGMDCAEEVSMLKRELVPLLDEDRLGFDVLNGKLTVDMNFTDVSSQQILSAIKRTGLKAETWREDSTYESSLSFWGRHQRAILTTISGAFGGAGLVTQIATTGLGESATNSLPTLAIAFYAVAIIAGLYLVLPKAWRSGISLRPDMNLLMSVAVVGAVLVGEWFEGATVAFLFSLSLLLESWSVGRARRAVAALMDLAPPTARIRDENGQTREVPHEQVDVGMIFIVRPAEKIPLDGLVEKGASSVNQAPITGESSPVDKRPGSEVYAGTINGDGTLEIKSTRRPADTTLAKIIRMVGDAQSKRSPSEQWVEKFAKYYTPAVMVLALLILIVPPLMFGANWSDWLYRALVLLVIACPCALVISTPVSIVASLAAAAKNGVLIKGGLYVEAPANLRALAVDKTGTLTHGTPRVIDVIPLNEHSEKELIERVAALEAHSNHPLALAIMRYADEKNISVSEADEFEIIQGKGARGVVNGKKFWLGSHRYLEEREQETPEVHRQLEELQSAGKSIIVVGNDDHVCGFISLADTVREETKGILDELREAGIENVVMLTGDNQGTAVAIAREVGIDSVHAELLPENKVEIVEQLVQRYENVAMVGDGVNDAPALARSSLGIAMGAVGTDAAIETADIALMSDDLSKVPWLIHHSRRTLSVIRQNIWFSLGVKLVFVVLAFAGFASLWAAIAADMGASLLVIFNSLRLLRE